MSTKKKSKPSGVTTSASEETGDHNFNLKSAQNKHDLSDDDAETIHTLALMLSQLSSRFVIVLFAVGLSILHRYHIATMFESDRHFSHLSALEREMTFRTEMGFYYSYYKTIVQAPTFWDGVHRVIHDNVTEYPDTINTLERFNLYPELILGALYRGVNHLGLLSQECWRTERGQAMEAIVSCEGMGDEFYFYINHTFALAGTLAGILFLFGVVLSDSIIGGFIVVSFFFFNHGEATRVQWSPPLRESFAYPVFCAQMLCVTYMLKHKCYGLKWSLLVSFLTVFFMLFWQFASFVLTMQVGSLFLAYVVGYVPKATMGTIAIGQSTAFVTAFFLLFGNKMLLTSLFLSSLITLNLLLSVHHLIQRLQYRLLITTVSCLLFAVGTLGLKFAISFVLNVKDDAHVFDILRAKFSDFSNFHTRLYTCAAEFDFMLPETPLKLTQTLLLPSALVALVLPTAVFILRDVKTGYWVTTITGEPPKIEQNPQKSTREDPLKNKVQNVRKCVEFVKPGGEILYNLVQLGTFTAMAIVIMRLKLFFTPHLCIVTSLLASRNLFRHMLGLNLRAIWQLSFCGLLIGLAAIEGSKNVEKQRSIRGEYSNPNQEELFKWVLRETPPNAVFAGSMPTMANLKLSTLRPIVNHPHYEDAGLRERVMKVYSIFSRKSQEEVYRILQDMKVDYIVFEYGWCSRGMKKGCTMPELWDLHDVDKRQNPALCDRLNNGEYGPFKLTFSNLVYKVLKIEQNQKPV